MKIILILAFLIVGKSWAEDNQPLADDEISTESFLSFANYQWLYDMIMEEKFRTSQPDRTRRSFEVHLKDTYQVFPNPAEISLKNIKPKSRIEGKITYVGIFPRKYRYDILGDKEKGFIINVKIFLNGATSLDVASFKGKLEQATDIWNEYRLQTDFPVRFQFEIEKDRYKAHYVVTVVDSTRGPYDIYWARAWGSHDIAHEVGHMLGLGDEYETLTGRSNCLEQSLMCQQWDSQPMPHHYYFIYRRLL